MEEETVENRFGFAGEMLDAVTGQYYLRARFYNPVIARFLSEDTYYGDGLNLYAYCHNNPVRYVDPSGHEGLICSKKYGELKKKETEGGTLSEKEKRQIYEYEQNQKKSNGPGSDSKSGSESSIMDYSNRFADSLADDFNHGVEVRDVVKEDMILVQFSSDAPNASLRYWTTIDEANGISTIEEYMDKMALSKEWGNRNVVKVARVKKGTEVTHAIGTAKAQTKISDPRPGNGKQILFSKFDSNWITEVRNIKE